MRAIVQLPFNSAFASLRAAYMGYSPANVSPFSDAIVTAVRRRAAMEKQVGKARRRRYGAGGRIT